LYEIVDRTDFAGDGWKESLRGMTGVSLQETTVERGKPVLGLEGSEPLVREIFGLSAGSAGTVQSVGSVFALPKLIRIVEPAVPPFEEVRAQAEEKYIEEESGNLLETESTLQLDRLKAGASLEEIAGELGLDIKDTGLIERDDFLKDVPSFTQIRDAAFSMNVGEFQKVRADQFHVLLKLEKKDPPTDAEFQEKREEYGNHLLNERREMAYQEWLQALRDRAEQKKQIFIDRSLL
jgi:parvulin-like peptidyl-prolyl isomerase